MEHKFYDFYMRFPSEDDALKAKDFYYKKHRPRIGGEFKINDNGVCSLSLQDECELITDLYPFGLTRYIVADNFHGVRREHGKDIFDFFTDSDQYFCWDLNDQVFEKLNNFLKNEIQNDGFKPEEGKHAPFVQRTLDSMGIDDLFNMLNVDAPGLDI